VTERQLFDLLLLGYLALSPIVFVLLLFVPAPYGRYTRRSFGAFVNRKLGWIIMEAPCPLWVGVLFVVAAPEPVLVPLVFLVLWEAHYLHRAFIFPFTMRGRAQHLTWLTVALGFFHNCLNGYLLGRDLFAFGPTREPSWLADPRFILGATLFVAGYVTNRQADTKLRSLRAPGETDYRVPHGGLFEWVSCPNYLGEIVAWLGFALATWSLAAFAFALFSIANLVPRALAHHRWYRQNFADYPARRRAIVPYLL
jgi:protein-S-isoprenylcysteine O-methyltransferase Ste14